MAFRHKVSSASSKIDSTRASAHQLGDDVTELTRCLIFGVLSR
jgi:hypothetical protein